MGTFRFILALLVALSHIRGNQFPENYGAQAVFAFYFLSGWLMAMSYERFSTISRSPARTFFVDRAIRLWPSYILALIMALAVALYGGASINAGKLFSELWIFPNAYFRFFGELPYVTPAWSLGVEVHFYLLVPLLFLADYRLKLIFSTFWLQFILPCCLAT
jgi:peptidoglycan/LPS O-acetylase OafA/YrhL